MRGIARSAAGFDDPPAPIPGSKHGDRGTVSTVVGAGQRRNGSTGDEVDPVFAQWLRSLRRSRGWSRRALAEACSYEETTIKHVENLVRPPSKPFLVALAGLLDVPVSSLAPPAIRLAQGRRVPAPLTRLIGREDDVNAVVSLLGRHRMVSVLGPPGGGKTRLAIEALGRIPLPVHGVCLVPLVHCDDPDALPGELARALGLTDPAASTSVDALVAALDIDLLLCLDDFDRLVGAADVLARIVAGTRRVRLLVTSRVALNLSGEAIHTLRPLPVGADDAEAPGPGAPVSPAVELFVERASAVRPGFGASPADVAVAARICARLDGLPLAIELAAGSCRMLTPQGVLRALEEGLDLPVPGGPDRPGHHRTLRAAIGWSYGALDPAARVLLDRLGVFEGGFTPEGAAAVAPPGTAPHPLEAVGALACRSLVQPVDDADGARFTLLHTVRQFALERLDAEGARGDARARHARFHLALAERAAPALLGPDQRRWLDRLDIEHRNLALAFDWLIGEDPDAALRLASACWRWAWYRDVPAGRTWLERGLAATAGGRHPSRVQAGNGLAVLLRTTGEVERGAVLLREALALARELGDDEGEGLSLLNLAAAAAQGGRYDEAERLLDAAEAVSSEYPRQLGHLAMGRGILAVEQHHPAEARRHLREGLARFEAVHDPFSAILAVQNLGWVAMHEGDHATAIVWHERALAMARDQGNELAAGYALLNLGRAQRRAGHGRALSTLLDALLAAQALRERRTLAETLEQISLVTEGRGDARTAILLWAVADNVRRETGTPLLAEDEDERVRALTRARARAGAEAAAAAWREGQALVLDAAIELALKAGVSGGRRSAPDARLTARAGAAPGGRGRSARR